MKLVAGSKICLAILGLILLCPNVGQAVVAPVFYNHPSFKEYVNGQWITVRSGSIEKMNPDGTHSTVVSGLNYPSGIDLDNAGNLYYGNVDDHTISLFKRTPDGMVTNLGTAVDRTGYSISIGEWGFDVEVSPFGDIFYNHPSFEEYVDGQWIKVRSGSIEKMNPDGTHSTVVSGLDYPSGIALDSAGNLYYGNVEDHTISLFKRTPDGMVTNLGTAVDRTGYSISIGEWGFDVAVPEPSTLFLLGLGSMALVRKRRA